ncbi:MAG: signal peptidase I [Lachnospiraceae bacterium]|nr:signal peptidase I [Lachnospiraceae bacterium]
MMKNKEELSGVEEEKISEAADMEGIELWEIGNIGVDEAESENAAKGRKADAGEPEQPQRSFVGAALREVISFAASLVLAWAVVMLIVTYVGTLCTVDGISMEDTLQDGDRLWADKLTYRFSDPQRFDIIIFPPQYDPDSKYIKRIIGLPGETVYIDEEGNIYIDGEILEEDYGRETIRADLRNLASQEITLGEDEYFVLGDNRNESLDSRYEIVGLVKRSDIFGKAVFRLWPLSGFGFLD